MQQQTPSATPYTTTTTGGAPRSLDELLKLDADALGALYRNGRVPRLSDLNGDLQGRMLAIPRTPAPVALVLRQLARSNLFPWRGKTFAAESETAGSGRNRIVSDRWRWFRFTTSIGRSRGGDFDAVLLDYDHPGNPLLIRSVRDEVREIAPGLYLGQAYVELRGRSHLVMYFGLAKP